MSWGGFAVEGGAAIHAGFLGFAGSGKTTTAFLLATALAKQRGSDLVAFYDTEGGARWLLPTAAALGVRLDGVRARSFAKLEDFIGECEKRQPGAIIVDSISHVWRDLCDAHLERINRRQAKYNRPEQAKLEFQDWNAVKADWSRWADWLVNTQMHVMVCGRAGYEYAMEENERGRKELVKTALKMKAEGEFTFEPDIVIEMRRLQEETDDGFVLGREAAVLKARNMALDGAVLAFPKTNDPHEQLRAVEVAFAELLERARGDAPKGAGIDLGGTELQDEENTRIARNLVLDEIKNLLASIHPGQTAAAKQGRLELMGAEFGTPSWQAVMGLPIDKLEAGKASLTRLIQEDPNVRF